MRRVIGGVVAVLGWAMGTTAQAGWWRLLEEDFAGDSSNRWTYSGVTNGSGQAMLRYDAAHQCIAADWSQAHYFAGAGDPHVILPSRLGRPLERVLTDRDTFRMGATVRVTAGSIPDTTEFFQIANFGLYNLEPSAWGTDRGQSDNYSANANLVRDANNLMEFNYFINNESFGFNPFIQATLITEMPAVELDSTAYFVTGTGADPFFHDTDMGPDTYLPVETNLYVEFTYYGGATGAVSRRVHAAIYTEPERTNLLTVGGVPMFYWTQPAPAGSAFRLSHAALLNWPSVNWGMTLDGTGQGAYDDLYVDLFVAPGEAIAASGEVMTVATVPGKSYAVMEAVNLVAGTWATVDVVAASADVMVWTNAAGAGSGVFQFEELP
jgi:hypothetical protein